MKQTEEISGQDFREMFVCATAWLEKSVADIDALNVFPVPDGDTGTNMLLTMNACIEEAYRAPDGSTAAIAQSMARGALMGARGNSGVILSQIIRGLAEDVAGKESLTAADVASALTKASGVAYKGLSNPVEGTILTVMKDASTAAEETASKDSDPVSVIESAVNAANASVANTPTLLPVLKEAGVVDAGGQGLYTLLEGTLHYLRGQAEQMQFRKPQMITSSIPLTGRPPEMLALDEVPFGYCTEFMLKGDKLKPDRIRGKLEKKGESLIVVGDDETVRVHIHTTDPGDVLRYITSTGGTMHQVSIRNMDEQHRDFLEMQRDKAPEVDMAIVAVAAGDGLREVFQSLGVTSIVHGGQTMNPSTKDILQAIEMTTSDKVIVLPNNKNIILAAEQTKSLTEKTVEIVATETIPQGVAALLAFDYEADIETNANIMRQSLPLVQTIEITRAVRNTRINDIKIKRKQVIGLLEGDLVAVGNQPTDVLHEVMDKLDIDRMEIVTMYYGSDTDQAEAEQVSATVRERHPHLQVEVVRGGQPHYEYIVSVE